MYKRSYTSISPFTKSSCNLFFRSSLLGDHMSMHYETLQLPFPDSSTPFRPLEQLMGVLPPASACFLPPDWAKLMTSSKSPLADCYPRSFAVDLNGKRKAWQGNGACTAHLAIAPPPTFMLPLSSLTPALSLPVLFSAFLLFPFFLWVVLFVLVCGQV